MTRAQENNIRDIVQANLNAEIARLTAENEMLKELLAVANCPACDGSGAIIREGHGPEYVSRDMAMEAGDVSLEGSIYRAAEPVIEQCQWCEARKNAAQK